MGKFPDLFSPHHTEAQQDQGRLIPVLSLSHTHHCLSLLRFSKKQSLKQGFLASKFIGVGNSLENRGVREAGESKIKN